MPGADRGTVPPRTPRVAAASLVPAPRAVLACSPRDAPAASAAVPSWLRRDKGAGFAMPQVGKRAGGAAAVLLALIAMPAAGIASPATRSIASVRAAPLSACIDANELKF